MKNPEYGKMEFRSTAPQVAASACHSRALAPPEDDEVWEIDVPPHEPLRFVSLKMGSTHVPMYIGSQCLSQIADRICDLEPDYLIVVTDSCVGELHGNSFVEAVAGRVPVITEVIPRGEAGKSMGVLTDVAERVVRKGVTRRSVVVTLGGGVPGNLGGLLGALLFRGLRVVHIPTTLVAVSDSVISLKQAVNSDAGKNLFGTYYSPTSIYADLALLTTLAAREIRSGICECIKNALVIIPDSIDHLESLLRPDCAMSPQGLRWLLDTAIRAKAQVMVDDAQERTTALILEYGHTVGHAVEFADAAVRGPDALRHGEAVGIGMVYAAEAAHRLGFLEASVVHKHRQLLERAGAPTKIPDTIDLDQVLHFLRFDNKRGYQLTEGDSIPMILLEDLGKAVGDPLRPLTPVPLPLLKEIAYG